MVEGPRSARRRWQAFTERLVPGRWDEVRPPSRQELKGTRVLALSLDEASAKVRTGGPVDDKEDYASDAWAGTVPLRLQPGAIEPDPLLRDDIPMSPSVAAWADGVA